MASNVSVRSTTTRECDKIELGLRITDEKIIEENTDDDEKRFQEIRYGKYVMAWRLKPRKMLGALIIEIIIGFLAILTATGKINTLPLVTSILYLVYIFLSSKTQNTVNAYSWYTEAYSWTKKYLERKGCFSPFSVLLKYTLLPLIVTALVLLDLVQVHRLCIAPQTLSFATADMVIIVASINYASRSSSLSVAIPLLVSFDFITKFSSHIAGGISIKDEDAIKYATENDKWVLDHITKGGILPIIAMISTVTIALVLVYLNFGIDGYIHGTILSSS